MSDFVGGGAGGGGGQWEKLKRRTACDEREHAKYFVCVRCIHVLYAQRLWLTELYLVLH
jgi:hypothetical protein